MTDQSHHSIIIIGGGPAGYTAAIYAARANLKPLVIQGKLPGGQLSTTTDVENYPGFIEGIMGPDLMTNMQAQAKRFGAEFKNEYVSEVDLKSTKKSVTTNKASYTSDTIIIATGANPRYLGLDNETELLGFGVSTCATCDGAFFRDVEIAIIGGGDSACEEALFLTRFASKVHLLHRRESLRASKIMQQRVLEEEKIEVHWNTVVSAVNGTKASGLESLTIKDINSNQESELAVKAMFIAIGHVPNTQIFENQLKVDENKYLITKPDSTATELEGVFACGDVQDHTYRQAITAAGSGCMAAIEVERFLATK